jgi:hypothetical protein
MQFPARNSVTSAGVNNFILSNIVILEGSTNSLDDVPSAYTDKTGTYRLPVAVFARSSPVVV